MNPLHSLRLRLPVLIAVLTVATGLVGFALLRWLIPEHRLFGAGPLFCAGDAFLVAALLGILGFAIWILCGRIVVRRILLVETALRNFADGESYDCNVDRHGHDEITRLAARIRSMVEHSQQELDARAYTHQRMVERTEEMDSIFRALSHDLRAPILNIKGFAKEARKELEVAKEKGAGAMDLEGLEESLCFIENSGSRIDEMQDELIRFAKVGCTGIATAPVDMEQLCSEITSSFQHQFEVIGGILRIARMPPCLGNRALLLESFSNLLDNAIKYRSPERPLEVLVSGAVHKELVLYHFADNGLGMEESRWDEAFALFRRLHRSSSVQGSGMGLPITRSMLAKIDGVIRISSSTPGQGTTFAIELPSVPSKVLLKPQGTHAES